MEDHILRHAPKGDVKVEDRLAAVMLRPEVIELLQEARGLLQPIFEFYVNQQELVVLDNHSGKDRTSGAAKREMENVAKSRMPMESFMRFSRDFELVPRLLTKAQLTDAFRCSRFGPAGSVPAGEGGAAAGPKKAPPEDLARIEFDEFVDAVGRLALMAFRFREPPQPLPTLGFHGAYQAAAKSLWLEDTQRKLDAEAFLPDEVRMPSAASMDGPIGHDDQARNDAADDTLSSRVASRGLSRSRSIFGRGCIKPAEVRNHCVWYDLIADITGIIPEVYIRLFLGMHCCY